MLKNQLKRVVPWTNRFEFESVFKELYSNDENQQLHAVGRIAVWKSRALHKLPVAIESTASLVNADIEYKSLEKSKQLHENHHKLQSLFSLALIRFVNHITEKGQTRQYAQPVHVLAAELGVPEWIVELRHDATHGSLPSLSMLRAAVNWALGWLKAEFWEKQLESMNCLSASANTEDESSSDERDVRITLKAYQEEKLKEFQEQPEKDRTAVVKILDALEKHCLSNRSAVISCLLEEGCLISTQQQLTSLQLKLNSSDIQLPDKLVTFWKPVLKLLHHLKLTSLLLRQMIAMVTTEMSPRNQILCGWIYTIITGNFNAGKHSHKHPGTQLYKSSTTLPLRMLLETCIKVPSVYTTPVIKLLLSKQVPPLPEQKIQQLTRVLDLFVNPECSSCQSYGKQLSDDINGKCFTLGDITIPHDMVERLHGSDGSDTNSSKWTLCTDAVDWSLVPIGCLPGQKLGHCDLELNTRAEESSCSSDEEENMDISEYTDETPEKYTDPMHPETDGHQAWTQQDMVKLKQMIHLL